MKKVSDYFLLENISETENFIVYRAKKENETQTVLIKILKTRLPTPSEIARFKREYNLVKTLDIEGIVKIYDIVPCNNSYAIIEEDFNGISLKTLLKSAPLNLPSFLNFALKITEILGILHWNQIIHLDIKPENIMINQKENRIKIIDFSIFTILIHVDDALNKPEVIRGTLSYMSPEQTGRMNRSIDYRTDLYSLGITFYEMLTGVVPFNSKDPMELIHSHIARKPQAPDEVNPAIPGIVSKIILKLLAKTPEERYQNSMGLMSDIRECIKQLNTKSRIDDFPLATKDISIRFNIPQIIVGREKETEKLVTAFERAASGMNELMLVLGPPGIGKSSLVNEIYKPITARRGYFISGKYDQFREDIPYSAIIQAFQGLIKQLLAENEDRITSWKDQLLTALSPNGKVITRVIPELAFIIGKQPEILELEPQKAENRFKLTFHNFIRVFTKAEHPLTIFLDDLQWADIASFNLLKSILADTEMKFLFLIATYRDNEVTSDHPLSITLDEIRKQGRHINSITLHPLHISDINSIITKAFRCDVEESASIAGLIHAKTAGNPFFVIQFLKKLFDSRIIEMNLHSEWHCDVQRIKELQVTDNVVKFLADNISNLPQRVQDILKICACIGNIFDLEILSFISGKSIDDTLSDLSVAIRENLVSSSEDMYEFYHDRIREAAYSLISGHEKAVMHYKIGSNVLKKTDEKRMPKKIFYIVDQLNRGIALVKATDERMRLAELNLSAGKKAIKSVAYASALFYLKTGMELLPENSWENAYSLTYDLHMKRMECEYLTFNFEEAIKIFHTILKHTTNKIDKVRAYTIMVSLYTNQENYKAAIGLGIEGMRIQGMKIPEEVTIGMVAGKLLKLYFLFGRRKIENILSIPFTTDRTILVYLDLLIQLGSAAYYTNPNLYFFTIIEGTRQILKHGLFKDAAIAFCTLAIIVGPGLGFYNQGYRFGAIAMKLNERVQSTKNNARAGFVFASFLLYWKKHLKYSSDLLREIYKKFYEVGDLFFAAKCINVLLYNRFLTGDNIDEILEEYEKHSAFLISTKSDRMTVLYLGCLCLKGLTDQRGSLNSGDFNEEKYLQYCRSEAVKLHLYFFSIFKIKIRYLFGKYTECIPLIDELNVLNKKRIDIGGIYRTEANFYSSLAIIALYREAGIREKVKYKKLLKYYRRKMKLWAKLCPENFLHKYLLVEAEWARIRRKYGKAKTLYAAAVKSAHENTYTQNEGIANERAALLMQELKDRENAGAYIEAARYCYVLWGAQDKVKQLDEDYPELLADQSREMPGTDSQTGIVKKTGNTNASTMDVFDLETVVKTSQSLSREIEIEKLLKNIMKLFIENAGAQHGYLILENEQDKKLYIEAAGKIDEIPGVLESIPLAGNKTLSTAIVQYVYKTGENIVLNNATEDTRFISDPYLVNCQPKSILCIPIKSKGTMTGIIYLENNLTTSAFIPGRVELLQVLSVQAAISIENSRLVMHRENAIKLETEIQLARKIQTVLLPNKPEIQNYEITVYMEPANCIGGDYYDIINTDCMDWIIIGDVSGHGISAGLVMMMVQTSIHTILDQCPAIMPSELLSRVNKTITRNIALLGGNKYMTITALGVKKNGMITFSGAHLDILVYRAKTGIVEKIETRDLWIGIMEDITDKMSNQSFKLETGDTFLLYTDGITEAFLKNETASKDTEECMFGLKKLAQVFCRWGKGTTGEILNGILKEMKQDYTVDDDVSIVVVKLLNSQS